MTLHYLPRFEQMVQPLTRLQMFSPVNISGFAYAISNTIECTVIPVLSGHSKKDKTKALKSCGSFMQVKSTVVLVDSAILLTCIKQFSVLKS